MNHHFGERLRVSLLVVAVIVGAFTPRRGSAEDAGTLRAQARTPETNPHTRTDVAEKTSFGPVIERLLIHPGDSRSNCVLDLDAGEFIAAPPEVYDLLRNRFDKVTKSGRPVEPIIRWTQSSGADLTLAMTSPEVMLVLYEGLISPAGSFDTTEPQEVLSMATEAFQQHRADDKPIPPMWMFQRPGPPHGDDAFVFQTREGGIGLLQMVGSTEEPRSVKIRYKWLVTEATQPDKKPSFQLQVIHLQQIESRVLLETLKQLKMIDQNLSAAAPKTNLLVLRGEPSSIMEALSLIELLDASPQAANAGKPPVRESEAAVPVRQADGERTSLSFLNPSKPEIAQDSDQRYKQELDSLQGTWSLEIIQTMSWPKPTGKAPDNFGQRSEREWVIRGNEITWISQTGREEKLTFTIDPTQSPKHFDVKFVSGPFRGKESRGIYERGGASGKMLWLCLTDPLLNTARPGKFGMDSISRQTLIGLMPAATTPDAASEDERISAIEGRLLQLNEPGSIMVVISLGADDGVKSGDILAILRTGKPIGRVKVSKVESDRSTATILAVEDVKALEVGDQVTNQKLPEGPPAPSRQSPQDSDAQRKPAAHTGVLSGRFVYDGEPPVAEDLYPSFAKLTSEQSQQLGPDGRYSGVEAFYREYLRHNIRPTTTDQSLRIGKERGLADVVIWVVSKDIPWTPPPQGPAQATIQIQNASFQPRVIALTVGQPLIIDNKDPVDQSLSAMFSRTLNPPFNILLKAGSTDSSTMMTFSVPEPFPARLSLDRCPWSKGLLFVHDNPYVAISQEDGSFRMPNLPPGEWEFQVWHQRSGYVSHWPKGRFTRKITPGDNNLGAIQLEPGQFEVGVADEPAPLVGEWRVVSAEMGGEPRDKLNFDGMRWTFGTETLEIGPGTFTPAGAAARPPLKCSYTVDNTQDPAHFNWTLGEGEQSIKVNAIYELKDDILRVCFPQHGEPRPDGFATKGHKWTVYELERDPQK